MQGCAPSAPRRSTPANTCATSLRVCARRTVARVSCGSALRMPGGARRRQTRLEAQRSQLQAHVRHQLALGGLLREHSSVLVLWRLLRSCVAVQHNLHLTHVLHHMVESLRTAGRERRRYTQRLADACAERTAWRVTAVEPVLASSSYALQHLSTSSSGVRARLKKFIAATARYPEQQTCPRADSPPAHSSVAKPAQPLTARSQARDTAQSGLGGEAALRLNPVRKLRVLACSQMDGKGIKPHACIVSAAAALGCRGSLSERPWRPARASGS